MDTNYSGGNNLANMDFAWDEETALRAVRRLEEQFGWTVCLFTRSDAEAMNTDDEGDPIPFTDEQWDTIRHHRRWRDLFDDGIMNDLWTQIAELNSDLLGNGPW